MFGQPTDINRKAPWDETIRTIISAVILALIFRSFAFEPFHIPSGSMKSNLLVGDYLFVSKYAYGYSRYSFPLGLPFFNGRIMEFHKPVRGDVVVFRPPGSPQTDFIKRIIGLPGDHIQVKGGIVYINGEELKRQPVDDYVDDENPLNIKTIHRFAETLPEGKVIDILKERRYGPYDDTPIFDIPPSHYFMMGDNRDNSADSRVEGGVVSFVPEENIVGRAEIIFFSIDGSEDWYNPASWFEALRPARFFNVIH